MYEDYSRQALPSRHYRELLGTAICVFNANNSFVIKNILRNDHQGTYSWFELIDRTSGELSNPVKDTITRVPNTEIAKKFNEIIAKRNRIAHSFQITAPEGSGLSDDEDNQLLATKHKNGRQEYITEACLHDFIRDNEALSSMLHELRGY